jgi:hypothetical protein
MGIEYEGEVLRSGSRCLWIARVWDGAGNPSAFGSPAVFETGLLQSSDWKGAWLSVGEEPSQDLDLPSGDDYGDVGNGLTPSPYMRKAFRLDKAVRRTRLCATARGVYGMLVDGTEESIATDGSWGCPTGPILYTDFLIGGSYDAREEMLGWAEPGFDDSRWYGVRVEDLVEDLAAAPLVAPPDEDVRVTKDVEAGSVAEPERGVHVFDMGQNVVGWVRLRVSGEPGTEVTIRRAEALDPDGTIYTVETYPLWGHTTKNGATTMWECWDGWTEEHGFQSPDMNSFNHYSLDSVSEWLHRYVAGIDLDPQTPGYGRLIIRPRPGGGLTHAGGEYDSAHGTISSAWRVEDDRFVLQVKVLADTTATLHVPSVDLYAITEGGVPLNEAYGVEFLWADESGVVLSVGSGQYEFECRAEQV